MNGSARSGSVGFNYLAVLVLLAAAAAAAAVVVSSSLALRARSEARYAEQTELEEAARAAVALLERDETGDADGPNDPVFAFGSDDSGGIKRSVRDASSAVNANFIRKAMLEKTTLSGLLAPDKTPAELQQFREDFGLSPSVEAYAAYFTEEARKSAVTGYGWANLNVSDEFALRKLCATATGSEAAAEAFHGQVQALLREKRLLKKTELAVFLGSNYDELYPFVNVEPAMNVNFVPASVLRAVVAYPDYGIPSPEARANAILSARESGDIAPAQLRGLLGVDETSPLLQYLGCRTWFWEFRAERGGLSCTVVAAAIPASDEGPGAKRRFEIIETRFLP